MEHSRRWLCSIYFAILAIFNILPSQAASGAQAPQIKQKLTSAQITLSRLVETSGGDPLSQMTPKDKQVFAHEGSLTIADALEQVSNLPVTIEVQVQLVGFDGEGYRQLRVTEASLHTHLTGLRHQLETILLEPKLQSLAVTPQVNFRVTRAPGALSRTVASALSAAVSSGAASQHRYPGDPILVPHQVVDKILREQVSTNNGWALTIFLLNPDVGGAEQHRYAYSYDQATEDGHHAACHGTQWVGQSPRYLWYDIVAGPPSYGPGPGKEGGVFPHTAPHPSHYRAHTVNKAIVPDLAALVWSAIQHWAWPPVQHLRLEHKREVVVQVIHMHDTLGPPTEKFRAADVKAALQTALKGFQDVDVHEAWISTASCHLCTAAYTAAMRVRTQRDEDVSFVTVKQTHFLESSLLHSLLAGYLPAILADSGIHMDTDYNRRIIPVLIYHTVEMSEPLLLTGGVKAQAFDDMVIAVTSRVGTYLIPHNCQWGKHFADSTEVTRDVLAALLTTGWGVVNTTTFYSPGGGLGTNYLWAVGSTPFDQLGTSAVIPGPMALAMTRNLVLVHANQSMARLERVLRGFQQLSLNGKFDKQSTKEHKRSVVTHVNVALLKLQQVSFAMTVNNHTRALAFARNLLHDVRALERYAGRIAKTLEGRMECETGPGLMSVWWAPALAVASWPVAIFLRSRFRPKLHKYY